MTAILTEAGKRALREALRPEFDPERDVRFRGKLIVELTPEELKRALIDALWRVYELEAHS